MHIDVPFLLILTSYWVKKSDCTLWSYVDRRSSSYIGYYWLHVNVNYSVFLHFFPWCWRQQFDRRFCGASRKQVCGTSNNIKSYYMLIGHWQRGPASLGLREKSRKTNVCAALDVCTYRFWIFKNRLYLYTYRYSSFC